MRVGGNDDSTFKPLDGTNYKQWAPKMKAYLMSKELWGYVSGTIPCPKAQSIPKELTPDPATEMITTAQCYNHGTDSLHYAILISWTGLVIFFQPT